MERLLALDIGDRWTGIAISDPLGITARPYETVETYHLEAFLKKTILNEGVTGIVVGYPQTLRGTESEQTKKVIAHAQLLKEQFPDVAWHQWDERLTSKQAAHIGGTGRDAKHKSHAIAAALILSSYLERLAFQKNFG